MKVDLVSRSQGARTLNPYISNRNFRNFYELINITDLEYANNCSAYAEVAIRCQVQSQRGCYLHTNISLQGQTEFQTPVAACMVLYS